MLRLSIAFGRSTVRSRLADLGQESFPREQQTPEALRALQNAEIKKVVADHQGRNIKAE